jgi:hypothetical protein
MVDFKSSGTKYKPSTAIVLVVFVACTLLLGACERSSGVAPEVTDSGTNAPALSAADPLAMTGLRFHESDAVSMEHLDVVLLPQGNDGQTLNIEGTLDIKLFELSDPVNLGLGDLLQQWSGVQVTAKDFTSAGLLVKLDFQGFKPVPGQMGYLEIKLTAGGRSVSAEGPFQVLKESCCLPTTAP